ncbi:ATPase, partial [Micromonospora phytophila]|nr:ATPase [Micromonospora phytophila]
LAAAVLTELLGSAEVSARPRNTVDTLIQAVTRRPPVELARLAPLVVAAADDGEPVAAGLIDEAAGHLAESATRIRPAATVSPVVLGGGLLTGDTPLATAVRAEVGRRWPGAPVCSAGDGAAAAAWLAARELPEVTDATALHELLVPTTS